MIIRGTNQFVMNKKVFVDIDINGINHLPWKVFRNTKTLYRQAFQVILNKTIKFVKARLKYMF